VDWRVVQGLSVLLTQEQDSYAVDVLWEHLLSPPPRAQRAAAPPPALRVLCVAAAWAAALGLA
jgi:hypothetical protein